MQALDVLYVLLVIFFVTQGLVNLFLSLYAWEVPERTEEVKSPENFLSPLTSFSVVLPARDEAAVIGETILSIYRANYPKHLFEILVVCDAGDTLTIAAAKKAIRANNIHSAKVVSFYDKPINKPHGLNVGLGLAKNSVTVIFDAEDNVHPDIFNIANTLYRSVKPDIIQAGVQLMNFGSRWFSSHNVLEYYFWFRSRMHFHTKVGMVLLGGNSVFFKTDQLRRAGGWDESCLTEDAEIGIRMSVRGAKIISTYDSVHVTKEETPPTLGDFIRQRTRWNQGFIQVLQQGEWKSYTSRFNRLFCLYSLAFPFLQSLMLLVTIASVAVGIEIKLPVLISLFSFLPLLIIFAQILINCAGLHEFAKEQKLKLKWRILLWMIMTFFFYQLLLGISALRATYRQVAGQINWEKTSHLGQHREGELAKDGGAIG